MDAEKLLAGILNWKEKEIEEVIILKDSYHLIKSKKKGGSLRIKYAPDLQLKKFQRRFLKYFLYRIPLDTSQIIKGFRPGFSYIDNAKGHARNSTRFVLRLDLKDAFPSVKTEYLRPLLKKILREEIERYVKKEYPVRPLFSVKKVRWFRQLIKDLPQLNLFYNPLKIIDEFIELVLSLVTYRGRLVQGAPTSPYLFNIVLYYSGLVEKIYRFLWDKKIFVCDSGVSQAVFSIYADDFTISSSAPLPRTTINNLIDLVEKELIFKINREKVFYFRRNRIAPLVTGLRLVRLIKQGSELETILSSQGLNQRERKNIKRKTLDKKGEWVTNSVSLPKESIKKIRGLINRGRYPPFQKALGEKITGYIACLKGIYGDKLPNQIVVPYQKYLNSLRS